ncbi:MAG: hypothetical protein BWY64_02152 [bacterium ADurb.Bin363]|nr:MAG: hypothetical protein BWY64_02152 [bacterium ADurb.Bin363]
MYSIKDLIEGAFDNPHIAAKARENMIFPFWSVIVGPKIAAHAKPYKLENGILKVIVTSSTWSQQLSFMKDQILRGYLDMIGEELVRDIRFQIGKRLPDTKKGHKTEQLSLDFENKFPDEFQLSRINLSEDTILLIKEQVKFIKDEQLREQMLLLIEKDFKIKLWKEQKGWKPCHQCQVLIEPGKDLCIICELEGNKGRKKREKKK